jgi:hypothetical protein
LIIEETIKDVIWIVIMTAIFVIFFSKNIKSKWKALYLYLLMFAAIRVVINLLVDYFI